MKLKLILVIILLLFLAIFIMQNYEIVKIEFLFWSFQTSRALIVFISLFVGLIIGWLTSYLFRTH